jgi:hypothetical protein
VPLTEVEPSAFRRYDSLVLPSDVTTRRKVPSSTLIVAVPVSGRPVVNEQSSRVSR